MKVFTGLLLSLGVTTSMYSEVLCDKTKLTPNQLGNPIYKDCKQPEVKISEIEKIAYRLPHENCTPQEMKEKKEAIKLLKEKGEWYKFEDESQVEKLATSIPDYEHWTQDQIKQYKQAVLMYRSEKCDCE